MAESKEKKSLAHRFRRWRNKFRPVSPSYSMEVPGTHQAFRRNSLHEGSLDEVVPDPCNSIPEAGMLIPFRRPQQPQQPHGQRPQRRRSGVVTVSMRPGGFSGFSVGSSSIGSPFAGNSISEVDEDMSTSLEDRDPILTNSSVNEDHMNNNSIPNPATNVNEYAHLSFPQFSPGQNRGRRASDAFVSYNGYGRGQHRQSPTEDHCNDKENKCGLPFRKFSVDSAGGILKRAMERQENKLAKSVSFSDKNSIFVFEDNPDEYSSSSDDEESTKSAAPESNKVLIPTFVFPIRKPSFLTDFRQKVVLLESVTVTEDLTLMGNVRVNLTLLKAKQTEQQRRRGQKISILAVYSTDNWATRSETLAFLVKGHSNEWQHPALTHVDTALFRFLIECCDLEVGQNVTFTIWCVDRNSGERKVSFEDDNNKRFYTVSCAPAGQKKSPAAKAAHELNNSCVSLVTNLEENDRNSIGGASADPK